jgi:hypothetical protein
MTSNPQIDKILEAPCIFCGYNGSGYWQLHTHKKSCPFFEIGGKEERSEAEDITFYRNGMKLNITRKAIEDFVFTGLINTDFVSTGALDEGICKKITTPKMMRNKK